MHGFPEDLIKGRIAQTVFELMFRECSDFDVFPMGYEYTAPVLVQYKNHPDHKYRKIIEKVLDNFSDTPDFMLVNQDKSKLYLVEVKYRSTFDPEENLKIAREINKNWAPVKVFLATPERFYYDSCSDIIHSHGNMTHLSSTLIPEDKKEYYLKLLRKFEK